MKLNIKKILLDILGVYGIVLRRTESVNPKMIIFSSTPDFSDNSKVLSDYLLNNPQYQDYEIYWRVDNTQYYQTHYSGSKIHFFDLNGWHRLSNMKLYYRAAWIFGTHGVHFYREGHSPKQHFIMLWHGCSYKDTQHKDESERALKADKVLVSGPLFVDTKSRFWNIGKEKILPFGYPRYDLLLKKSKKALELYANLIGENKHIVIWMPTFRNDKNGKFTETNNIRNFPVLTTDEDWKSFDNHCRDLNVLVLVKLHPFQKDYPIAWKSFSNVKLLTNKFLEENGVDLYSFISVTDGLISDYSSVAVDYLIVNKPIAYTLDDYDQYKDGRGFIVDNPLRYMPGSHVYTLEDLKIFIDDVSLGNDPYMDNRKQLFGTLLHQSDNYCKEILEILNFD